MLKWFSQYSEVITFFNQLKGKFLVDYVWIDLYRNISNNCQLYGNLWWLTKFAVLDS